MPLAFPKQSHVFIDECKDKGYYLAAAVIASGSLARTRTTLRKARHKGSTVVHFVKEKSEVKEQFLEAMGSCGIQAVIYESTASKPAAARKACLDSLVEDIAQQHVRNLILESDESINQADRQIIARRLREVDYDDLEYRDLQKHEEPLLWASDAVAWCYNRGGEWRKKISPFLLEVRTC